MSKPKVSGLAVRTQQEVADIMTARGYPMGASAVWCLEKNALKKLRWGLARIARELGYVDDKEVDQCA